VRARATGIDAAGAHYELRITNGTPGVLAARASAVRVDEMHPVAAIAVEIRAHSAIRTGFSLDSSLAVRSASPPKFTARGSTLSSTRRAARRPAATALGAPVIAVGAAGLLAARS